MPRRAALLLLLLACFPDGDKLRAKGGSGSGSGGNTSGGGSGGTGGPDQTGGSSGGPGTGGAAPVNRMQLCNELAQAGAAKAHACAPFLQAVRFGSQAAQEARIRLNCNLYDLPGVNFPPSPFQPCADALADQDCSAWEDGITPAECRTPGSIPAGGGCTTGDQCETDLCDLPPTGCGKCAPLPDVGEPCYKGFCALGLVCSPAGSCVAPGGAGDACDADQPCVGSLACHGGKCSPRGAPGAACSSNEECDVYHGTVCGAMNTKCVPAVTGSMCTIRPDGTYVFCTASATCKMDGSCLAAAADGGSCSTGPEGPDCIWPARCLSDMKCHLFQGNPTCTTMAPAPVPPGPDPLPPEAGVDAFWRSLVPRPLER